MHFTIMAAMLVIAVAIQFQKQPAIQRAAQDATAILHIAERWQQANTDLNAELDRTLAENVPAKAGAFEAPEDRRVTSAGRYLTHTVITENNKRLRQVIARDAPSAQVELTMPFSLRSNWLRVLRVGNQYADAGEMRPWQTLNSFLRFWDEVHEKKLAYVPLEFLASSKGGGCSTLTPDTSNVPEGEAELVLKLDWISEAYLNITPFVETTVSYKDITATPGRTLELHGESRYSCRFATVRKPAITPHLGRAFARLSPQAQQWGDRRSVDEFGDLISSAQYLEDTPLQSLAASLNQRANLNTDNVELFGAKIPATAIPLYGSGLVLLCLLYLYVQLGELQGRAGEGQLTESYGYIGIYNGPTAFLLTVLSLIALPSLLFAVEIRHASGYFVWVLGSALLIAATLGIMCTIVLARTRAMRVQRESPQASGLSAQP